MKDKNYRPSQFNHWDYKRLYNVLKDMGLAGTGFYSLRFAIVQGQYRDKRIRRQMRADELQALLCSLEDLPLHMSSQYPNIQAIVKWRFELGK